MNIDLSSIKDVVLAAAGVIVIIILIVRVVVAYGRKQYGEMVTEIMGAVFVFWVCFFNDQFVAAVKALGSKVF